MSSTTSVFLKKKKKKTFFFKNKKHRLKKKTFFFSNTIHNHSKGHGPRTSEILGRGGTGFPGPQGLCHQVRPKDFPQQAGHLPLVGNGAVLLNGEDHWVTARGSGPHTKKIIYRLV